MTVSPKEYVAALKAEGLQVTAHPGWTEENRPGPWDPFGLAVHHTGPFSTVAGMVSLLQNGRADLPGPLCQAGGRPSGIIDLVGWHDCNHAGLVDPAVLAAMRRDLKPPRPRAGKDSADGNAALFGLELMHPGNGKTPWPDDQVESAVRYSAALCRLCDWSVFRVVYHKGLTTRKPDPAGFGSIATFRAKVKRQLTGPLTHKVKPGETVNDVAERYDVSVAKLWRENRPRIVTGELLVIPR